MRFHAHTERAEVRQADKAPDTARRIALTVQGLTEILEASSREEKNGYSQQHPTEHTSSAGRPVSCSFVVGE